MYVRVHIRVHVHRMHTLSIYMYMYTCTCTSISEYKSMTVHWPKRPWSEKGHKSRLYCLLLCWSWFVFASARLYTGVRCEISISNCRLVYDKLWWMTARTAALQVSPQSHCVKTSDGQAEGMAAGRYLMYWHISRVVDSFLWMQVFTSFVSLFY